MLVQVCSSLLEALHTRQQFEHDGPSLPLLLFADQAKAGLQSKIKKCLILLAHPTRMNV